MYFFRCLSSLNLYLVSPFVLSFWSSLFLQVVISVGISFVRYSLLSFVLSLCLPLFICWLLYVFLSFGMYLLRSLVYLFSSFFISVSF